MYLTVGNAIDPQTGIARPVPPEYLDFLMCEFYRCPPDVLRRQERATVDMHMKFLDLRAIAKEMREGQSSGLSASNTLAAPPPATTVDALDTLNVEPATGQMSHASTQYH